MYFRQPLLLSLLAASLLAQGSSPQEPKPKNPQVQNPPPKATQVFPAVTPNSWFAKVQQSVVVEDGTGIAVGRFPFQNPKDGDIEWREFGASCACSHLEFVVGDRHYWLKPKPRELVQLVAKAGSTEVERVPVDFIPVHGGERGSVEVHVELTASIPKKSVSIDIHTTDAELPQMRLQVDASHGDALVLTPPEVELGAVLPGEVREFAVEVHASGRKDFTLEPPTQLPAGIHVECSKATSNNISVWTIRGTYGPYEAGKGGAATLKFSTNLKEQTSVDLRVNGVVALPVSVWPGFLTMGRIDPTAEKRMQVRFHANDGTDLEATKVTFANLSPQAAKVESKVTKDGKDVLVEVVVPIGATVGLLRGDLLVELNHPKASSFKVLFNGFVR